MQRYSKMFGKTNKSAKEYDSKNATLLQKGGFVEQTMAGVYNYLPMGLRVLNKIENIVREEMDKVGNEMLMSALAPFEYWETTGRLDTVDVLMKTTGANEISKNKSSNEYILNPSQEEIVTPVAKRVKSYKEFPFALYQIQNKFRNEARPKSGILRGREFRMKDLYSFHTSEEDLDAYYDEVLEAYKTIFDRLGMGEDTYVAMASGGDFSDGYSHEFQTLCEVGEDDIYIAKEADVVYNKEVAPSKAPVFENMDEDMLPMEEVLGEGMVGVEKLAEFLNIPVEKTTKTMIYETEDGRVIAAAVRGGYEINEEKLRKVVKCKRLTLASEETVRRVTGAEVGYAGLLGLTDDVEIFMDDSTANRRNFEMGTNRTNYHTINVNFGRDIETPEKFYDFKMVKEGDMYPETGEVYEVKAASEVGNTYHLYTKYTDAFDYTFTDQDGKEQPVQMGCYGIGTTRIMGVLVEKFHDENGITWPESVAPFDIHFITLGDELNEKAEEIIKKLEAEGKEVLWDDRDTRPGEKFGDADLLGCPVRIVLSSRSMENGGVEVKYRKESEAKIVPIDELKI